MTANTYWARFRKPNVGLRPPRPAAALFGIDKEASHSCGCPKCPCRESLSSKIPRACCSCTKMVWPAFGSFPATDVSNRRETLSSRRTPFRIVRQNSVGYLLRGTRPSGASHKRYPTLIDRALLSRPCVATLPAERHRCRRGSSPAMARGNTFGLPLDSLPPKHPNATSADSESPQPPSDPRHGCTA